MYWVLAAAVIVAAAAGIGVGHLVGRHRGRADPADQLIGLRIQRGGQIAVLVGLRGSQFEGLDVYKRQSWNSTSIR